MPVLAAHIKKHLSDMLGRYAQEGIGLFRVQHESIPVLSHACFKFSDSASYQRYVDAIMAMGSVTCRKFGEKDIVWCHLNEPWVSGALHLEWLELVEPKPEGHICNAVSSIGYAVENLPQVVKILSKDDGVVFRFQSKHAQELAV